MTQFRTIVESILAEAEEKRRLSSIDYTICENELEEGSIGKGAMILAAVGATLLGMARTPKEAMCKVSPESNIELETEIQKDGETGKAFYHIDSEGMSKTTDTTLTNGMCKKLTNDHKDNDGTYYRNLYDLDCQSENGEYNVSVTVMGQGTASFNDNVKDSFDTYSLHVNFGEVHKEFNLNDPNLINLKNVIKDAINKDAQDNKLIKMVDDTDPGESSISTTSEKNLSYNG